MNSLETTAAEKEKAKSKLIEILEENDFNFKITDCCHCGKICIDCSSEAIPCESSCFSNDIIVQTSNKDVCRIRPCEILYIAIEKRKSAIYIDNRRIETTYPLSYWKSVLNPKMFAQPHSSFIVNFKYVENITKDFIKLKYGETEHLVYTSSRKINGFKKAFLEFGKQ